MAWLLSQVSESLRPSHQGIQLILGMAVLIVSLVLWIAAVRSREGRT